MTGYKQCKPGDLIINTMWAWMGALGTSKHEGICSPAYGVYRPRRGVDYHAGYFDTLFNAGISDPDPRDEIEVYFDNQIGIIELAEFKPEDRKSKRRDKIAEGGKEGQGGGGHAFSILDIIAKRNEGQEKIGQLIAEFEGKIATFFQYIREDAQDGTRLIVKIRSGSVPEEEIHADFGKIYRKYRLRNIRTVGDEFFKAMDDIVDKLCDDFENVVLKQPKNTYD